MDEIIQMVRQSKRELGKQLQLTLLYAVLDGVSFNLFKEKPELPSDDEDEEDGFEVRN